MNRGSAAAALVLAGVVLLPGRKEPGAGETVATMGPDTTAAYKAHGNEPFWGLEIGGNALLFRIAGGDSLSVRVPQVEPIEGGRRYTIRVGDSPMVVTVIARRCVDDMGGMTYPDSVTVLVGGREYRGCGGDPAAVLGGDEWVVEDISRGGIIDRSRMTLGFGMDGRLTGLAGCNTYTSRYTLTGEGLTVADVTTTRKACAPALMQQEKRFLAVLRAVRRFEIDRRGALILHTDDGRSILARR